MSDPFNSNINWKTGWIAGNLIKAIRSQAYRVGRFRDYLSIAIYLITGSIRKEKKCPVPYKGNDIVQNFIMMNWNYIAGFLDADGSVQLTKLGKYKKRSPVISFCNNERVILNKIRSFIEKELGIKGSLVTKKPRKDTHSENYELKYAYKTAVNILLRVDLLHPKKRHRKNIILKWHKLTVRNGKYSEELLQKREELLKHYK